MAKNCLLIFLVFAYQTSYAQISQVRNLGIKAEKQVDPNVQQIIEDTGWGGHQAIIAGLQRNMPRYINSCLFNQSCQLTETERAWLNKILELSTQDYFLFYFASSSQDLFANISESEKQNLLSLGYSPDKDLFDLSKHKTHRLVVTQTQPSPIIFNQEFFESSQNSPQPFELISYLIHEIGHHSGLGFENEAALDRLSEKVRQHLASRGSFYQSPIAPNLKMFVTNFTNSQEYFEIGPKKVAMNNVGEIVLYNDQTILRLSELPVAASFDPKILDEGVESFIYFGVGAPRYAGLRDYKDEKVAQVVQGPLSLVALNSKGTGGVRLNAQYEFLIPMQKTDGVWQYSGEPVMGSINNLKNANETIVKPDFNYKIYSLEKTLQPTPGLVFEMTCAPEESELKMVGQMIRPNLQKIEDYDSFANYAMQFLKEENGHCFYHLNQGSQASSAPAVSLHVEEVLIFPPLNEVIRVVPDRRYVIPLGNEDIPFPETNSFYRNLLVSWARYDSQKQTWIAFEKIEGDRKLKQEYLDDSSLQIIVEADLSFAKHSYCGGLFTVKGKSKLFPDLPSNIFLGDHFLNPYDNAETSRIFSYLNFQTSGTDVSMIGLVNMPWVRTHVREAEIHSLGFISCATGFMYHSEL